MRIINSSFAVVAAVLGLTGAHAQAVNWTEGFKSGKPVIKSINQLTFGPEGILFVADSKSAAIVAIATGDNKAAQGSAIKIEAINQKIAALLGTTADQILIDDMAVNPISHKSYLAVSRGRGPTSVPVIVRVDAKSQLEVVNLDDVLTAKPRGSLCLVDESMPDLVARGVVRIDELHRDARAETFMDALPHRAHPALAEQTREPVFAGDGFSGWNRFGHVS